MILFSLRIYRSIENFRSQTVTASRTKMKSFIVLAVALTIAYADVSHIVKSGNADQAATIVRSSSELSPEGNFQWSFETSNGINALADGVVKNPNSDNPALEVKGQANWVAPDGSPVQLTYVANEDGYQPSGNALPQAPPTPEAILRSLAWIAAHPPPVERGVNPVPVQQSNFGKNFG